MAPRSLSKSKLIAFRQCPRRLWLEVHKPELRQDSAGSEARMEAGNELGRLARKLYDPEGKGETIDAQRDGFSTAIARSKVVLAEARPVFEAGFVANGALAFADVMLPVAKPDKKLAWRMVEVKSSTSVKDYHREDAAIQAYISRAAGVPLEAIAVAHIDSDFVYPGDDDYRGLLVEEDLTAETTARAGDVEKWIGAAHEVAAGTEPALRTGGQCSTPFACGYYAYCSAQEPQPELPVGWLPRLQRKEVKDLIETKSITDLREVPDEYLNELQLRVKRHTIAGTAYFDKAGASKELGRHRLPASFLDFETVQFTIPIWEGTRPYQQLPFQYSLHRLGSDSTLEHVEFLDLTGADPCRQFAASLVAACGGEGPVFVYNAQFESGRIRELAARFPDLEPGLIAITQRIVDLLPIARRTYYHPDQHGSWSIKSLLPTLVPDLRYDALSGVKDGAMASAAFLEAIRPETTAERREQIRRELLEYCWLDTYALVRVWQHLAGHGTIRM